MMRYSLVSIGFIFFSFGIILLLPAIVVHASDTGIKTTKQAVSFIAGDVIKNFKVMDLQQGSANFLPNTLEKFASLFVLAGIIIIAASFFLRFI